MTTMQGIPLHQWEERILSHPKTYFAMREIIEKVIKDGGEDPLALLDELLVTLMAASGLAEQEEPESKVAGPVACLRLVASLGPVVTHMLDEREELRHVPR